MNRRTNVLNMRERILEYLASKDFPVSPREIAQKTGFKANSVRPRLIELLREGRISRPYRGYYQHKPIHGVGELPTVQNLVFFLEPYPLEEKIPDYDDRLFGSHLRIQYGVKRQRVTWYVSNGEGLDLDGLRLALEVLRMQHALATGDVFPLDLLEVSTIELSHDYHGIRWDRKGCITLKSFLGGLEKIYQKGSLLRSEVKVQPQSLGEIYALLKGGVVPYNVVQTQMMSVQRMDRILKQNERILGHMASIGRYLKALVERR